MSASTLRCGPSPTGLACVVPPEDGTGPTLAWPPESYEKARSRTAFAEDVNVVRFVVDLVGAGVGVAWCAGSLTVNVRLDEPVI